MIKFEHVYFTYSPKSPFEYAALEDINLTISKNSFTCIVGKTGSGKSTLIQQLNGLLLPTKGKICVDDFVISANKKERTKKLQPLRKHLGIVFQFSENQLFEESVEEDVAFGPTNFGISKQDAIKIAHKSLERVGLPASYYKRSPFELSGGEKRRVSIAGILALEPEILVLDEPTAGLDPRGEKEMLTLFKSLASNGTTIIIVTHDMNIVFEYASDVIVLSDGKVVFNGKPSSLFLQDVEKYSLETPMLAKTVQKLIKNGHHLDLDRIHDINSLVDELKGERNV